MKNENGFSIISLIFYVGIIIAIIYGAGVILFGENGIFKHYSEVDSEFNKSEVVETLNLIIREKYFADSKYCQENNKNINEVYTESSAIAYLLDNRYLTEFKTTSDEVVPNEYYINVESLNRDISTVEVKENGSAGDGTKMYVIKIEDAKYNIYFINQNAEEEMLGELVLYPKI